MFSRHFVICHHNVNPIFVLQQRLRKVFARTFVLREEFLFFFIEFIFKA